MKVTLVVAVLITSAVAGAQPAPDASTPSPEVTARAKAFYDEGTKQYDLSQFATAVDAFRKAYDLLPEPLFLFDIGQSYRQLHDCENARSSYKSYLRNLPAADNRAKVEHFIADMDECVRKRDEAREAERTLALRKATPPERDHRLLIAGLITGATGLAAAGGGVYFSIDASNQARHLEQACIFGCDAVDVAAIDAAGHDAGRNAVLLYVVGGAALAAGVGMIVWTTMHADPESVIVTPTPGGATISTAVRF
jgi:tetratricopeptide (TPR) repeat protein